MKDKVFTSAIHDLFKKINKAYHKTLRNFEVEEIHDFRLDIKKLRALLGLISYHYHNIITLGLTKKIKTFYGYVGIVRNLQLQQQVVREYCLLNNVALPAVYLERLHKEEIYWKKQAVDYMSDGNNFWDDEESIIKNLPPQLNEKAAGKYLKDKLITLQGLLAQLPAEDKIHSSRKLLKDVLYTWQYLPHHKFTGALQSKDDLAEITNLLGEFRDICIAINHLQDSLLRDLPDEAEKLMLEEMARALRVEKEQMKQVSVEKLQALFFSMNSPKLSLHSPAEL